MNLRNCKVGDYIFTIQSGWTKVAAIEEDSKYPIVTNSIDNAYTPDGKHSLCHAYPSAFLNPPKEFNAPPKPTKLVKGQRVLAGNYEARRYFSHMEGDLFCCFVDGKDEWSSEGKTSDWGICAPAEEVKQ